MRKFRIEPPGSGTSALRKVLCAPLEWIFPDDCRVCGVPLQECSRIPVCGECLKSPAPLLAEYFCSSCGTPFLNPSPLDESGHCMLCRLGLAGFDRVYSFGSYEGALRKLIHLFKYDGVQPLARPFGEFLARALPPEERFDLIVPVPLHWLRRWKRGFNQSALLAREISRRRNVPVRAMLRRTRSTAPQVGLTNSQRRANVSGAFSMKKKARLDGMRVLLIDDVLTTGASAAACARILKRAGAVRVTVLMLARTDRRASASDSQEWKTAAAGSTFA